jgi:hypothetical protein
MTMERLEPTAEASFAAMRARSKFGIAMAAMIKIIATTIKSSIKENPFCLLVNLLLNGVSPGSLRAGHEIRIGAQAGECNTSANRAVFCRTETAQAYRHSE